MSLLFYTGGYTAPTAAACGDANGITLYEWEETNGVRAAMRFSSPDNPSYLCLHPQGNMLYGVGEDIDGWVFSCQIGKDGALSDLQRFPSYGDHPCHIALNADASILAVCNYTSGSVSFYRVAPNGAIMGQSAFYSFQGNGNHPTRQDMPHTHTAAFYGGYCYVCELGCDKIYRISEDEIKSKTGLPQEVFDFTKDGNITGVRMGVFSTDGYYFAGGELDNRIHCFAAKRWEYLGSVNAAKTEGENYFAHIALSTDEKYLYASIRGENTIVRFTRKGGALLDPIWFDCGGSWPRMFALMGEHLVCANQYGAGISIFKLQQNTGIALVDTIRQPGVSMILPIK